MEEEVEEEEIDQIEEDESLRGRGGGRPSSSWSSELESRSLEDCFGVRVE